ncbi:hypothetical protein PHYC_00490 [Phycisphaerales bacterium]|nr:hypothetical protein PHYC_00490 [Phycisphaerales bacterium]
MTPGPLQLASAPPRPLRIITGDEPVPVTWPEWLTWTVVGAAGVVLAVWFVVRVIQRHERSAAEDIAFRKLSGRSGRAGDRRLLETLAAVAGVSPLALWISDQALSGAVEVFARSGADAGALARVGALCERRGVEVFAARKRPAEARFPAGGAANVSKAPGRKRA